MIYVHPVTTLMPPTKILVPAVKRVMGSPIFASPCHSGVNEVGWTWRIRLAKACIRKQQRGGGQIEG